MTVIAGTRQPLGRDRPAFSASPCLQDMEEGEAHRLLDFRIALQLDDCPRPEIVQVSPLLSKQTLPTGHLSSSDRRDDLVMDGRSRTQARPAIGNQFNDTQALAGPQPARNRHTHDILRASRLDEHSGWPLDVMVHYGPHE